MSLQVAAIKTKKTNEKYFFFKFQFAAIQQRLWGAGTDEEISLVENMTLQKKAPKPPVFIKL